MDMWVVFNYHLLQAVLLWTFFYRTPAAQVWEIPWGLGLPVCGAQTSNSSITWSLLNIAHPRATES